MEIGRHLAKAYLLDKNIIKSKIGLSLHLNQMDTLITSRFFARLKWLFILTGHMILSSKMLFAETYSYSVVLSPKDCLKCSESFFDLEQNFFGKYKLKYHLYTPYNSKQEGLRLAVEHFRLVGSNILRVNTNPKLYQALLGKRNYSQLIVRNDKNDIIFQSDIVGILIENIPIALQIRESSTSLIERKRLIPYYANELQSFGNNLLLSNILYKYHYLLSSKERKIDITPIVLNDTLYEFFLTKFLKLSSADIVANKSYFEKRRKPTLILHKLKVNEGSLYSLIGVYTYNSNLDEVQEFYVLSEGSIKSMFATFYFFSSEVRTENISFDVTTLYPFTTDSKGYIFSLFADVRNASNLNKTESLYTSALYSKNPTDDSVVFNKFLRPTLDSFYINRRIGYTNTWFAFATINDTIHQYYQYLNYTQNVISGELIKLNNLDYSGLVLPLEPGGNSKKPFEMLTISQIDGNHLFYSFYSKGTTYMHIYNLQTGKVSYEKKIKTPIKPSCCSYSDKVVLSIGNINASISLKEYTIAPNYH